MERNFVQLEGAMRMSDNGGWKDVSVVSLIMICVIFVVMLVLLVGTVFVG